LLQIVARVIHPLGRRLLLCVILGFAIRGMWPVASGPERASRCEPDGAVLGMERGKQLARSAAG